MCREEGRDQCIASGTRGSGLGNTADSWLPSLLSDPKLGKRLAVTSAIVSGHGPVCESIDEIRDFPTVAAGCASVPASFYPAADAA